MNFELGLTKYTHASRYRIFQKAKNVSLMLFIFPLVFVSSEIQAHQFQEQLQIETNQQNTLNLTGVSKRSVMLFDIYRVGHYSSNIEIISDSNLDVYSQIIESSSTKQISIIFSRDLTASKIQSTLSGGVEKVCVEDEFERVQNDLDLFKSVIKNDVKKDDEFALRWLQDGRLQMFFKGEIVGEVNSPLLARLLWSIWFGEDSVVNREELVKYLSF